MQKNFRLFRLRLWLRHNKIFFETIATFLVSIMAFYVSWQTYKISEQNTKLASIQAMPFIEVIRTQRYDDSEKMYTDNFLEIYNRNNGMIRDLTCNTAVFLDIEKTDKNQNNNKIEIPLNGYYFLYQSTAQAQGLIMVVTAKNNNKDYYKFRNQLMEYAKSNNILAYPELREYVKITYKDILGGDHTNYFDLSKNSHGVLMNNGDGEKVFRDYKNGQLKAKELSSLSLDDIPNLVN